MGNTAFTPELFLFLVTNCELTGQWQNSQVTKEGSIKVCWNLNEKCGHVFEHSKQIPITWLCNANENGPHQNLFHLLDSNFGNDFQG